MVVYAKFVAELRGTTISDDSGEDQTSKKTIANCSYGMLEKQINKKVKSKIFDSYEDAKYFQLKYGGDITFIKQYERQQPTRQSAFWTRALRKQR